MSFDEPGIVSTRGWRQEQSKNNVFKYASHIAVKRQRRRLATTSKIGLIARKQQPDIQDLAQSMAPSRPTSPPPHPHAPDNSSRSPPARTHHNKRGRQRTGRMVRADPVVATLSTHHRARLTQNKCCLGNKVLLGLSKMKIVEGEGAGKDGTRHYTSTSQSSMPMLVSRQRAFQPLLSYRLTQKIQSWRPPWLGRWSSCPLISISWVRVSPSTYS